MLAEGDPMPRELARWAAAVLKDQTVELTERQKPRPTKGEKKWLRDIYVIQCVKTLVREFSLSGYGTRYDGNDCRSPCDVIAEVGGQKYTTIASIMVRNKGIRDWVTDEFSPKINRRDTRHGQSHCNPEQRPTPAIAGSTDRSSDGLE